MCMNIDVENTAILYPASEAILRSSGKWGDYEALQDPGQPVVAPGETRGRGARAAQRGCVTEAGEAPNTTYPATMKDETPTRNPNSD